MTLQKTARNLTIATGVDTDDEDETSHYEKTVVVHVAENKAPAATVMSASLAS
jgi:hypothetical protein